MASKTSIGKVFSNGLLKENPVLRLVLGTCPTLAVTTVVFNGIGMGIAATFVLICSNVVISLLRKVIPDKVRLPCFIIVIASFVTLVHMLIRAYLPDLNSALGVFLPLITVNCIILGRAEMFASKNGVVASAIDGLGMGIGFTITLILMSAVRELLGAGTITLLTTPLVQIEVVPSSIDRFTIMQLPPGGFFVFGLFMALAIFLERKMGNKPNPQAIGCGACPVDDCPVKGEEA